RFGRDHPLGGVPDAEADQGHALLEGEAHPAVGLLRQGVLEQLQDRGVADVGHLNGGGAARDRILIDEVGLARERIDQRPDGDAQAPPAKDFRERGQVDQQRFAVGSGDRITPVRGEEGDEGLVPLADLVADDHGVLLAPREGAHVDAALAQRLEQGQDLSIARLAQRDRGAFLHRRVRGGHVRDVLGDGLGGSPRALRYCRGGEPRQQREREEERSPHERAYAFFWYVPWCLIQSQPLSGLVYWLHGSAFTRPL